MPQVLVAFDERAPFDEFLESAADSPEGAEQQQKEEQTDGLFKERVPLIADRREDQDDDQFTDTGRDHICANRQLDQSGDRRDDEGRHEGKRKQEAERDRTHVTDPFDPRLSGLVFRKPARHRTAEQVADTDEQEDRTEHTSDPGDEDTHPESVGRGVRRNDQDERQEREDRLEERCCESGPRSPRYALKKQDHLLDPVA